MSKTTIDFGELKRLSNRIDTAVRMAQYDNEIYSNRKILEAGAYELMKNVVKETPNGKSGSNWYNYTYTKGDHSAHYFLAGRAHRSGTLKRGWVTPETGNPELGGRATYAMVKSTVQRTPIQHKFDGLSMKFYNTTPYADAIEGGHWVRMPYFMGPPGTKRGQGPITGKVGPTHFTQRAIWHSEVDVTKAMKKECKKMLKQVVKG